MNRKDGGKGGRKGKGREPSAGARKKTSGNEARRRRFSEFLGVKREKKRDNCLISNKNH